VEMGEAESREVGVSPPVWLRVMYRGGAGADAGAAGAIAAALGASRRSRYLLFLSMRDLIVSLVGVTDLDRSSWVWKGAAVGLKVEDCALPTVCHGRVSEGGLFPQASYSRPGKYACQESLEKAGVTRGAYCGPGCCS